MRAVHDGTSGRGRSENMVHGKRRETQSDPIGDNCRPLCVGGGTPEVINCRENGQIMYPVLMDRRLFHVMGRGSRASTAHVIFVGQSSRCERREGYNEAVSPTAWMGGGGGGTRRQFL